MTFDDMFEPYSPEIRGDLEGYLRNHDGMTADNQFYGPEYFFVIKEKGLMIPGDIFLSVDQSPAPDVKYSVNSDYLLESRGSGPYNMSLMGAKEGVYDPNEALRDRMWSISGLNILEEPAPPK